MDNNELFNRQAHLVWVPINNFVRKHSAERLFIEFYNNQDNKYLKSILQYREDVGKDVGFCDTYRKMGIRSFDTGDYMHALYFFNECLLFAPTQHEHFGLALEYRSEVFFRLGKYAECLADIELIPTTQCPKYHYYKIYIRKCCCYYNLKEYKNAWTALEEAKLAFACTDASFLDDNSTAIERKLLSLEKDLREFLELIDSKLIQNEEVPIIESEYIPSLFKGENKKIINASNAVKILKNNRLGKYVVAKDKIEIGAVLFVEEPYCISNTFSINHLSFFCNNCLKSTVAFIPCNGCIDMHFCSLWCKDTYWNIRHKWECVGYRKNVFTPIMTLALGIVFRASFSNFKRKVKQNVFGDKIDNYGYIRTLTTNLETVPSKKLQHHLRSCCWIVTYLKYYTTYFQWLRSQNPEEFTCTKKIIRTIGGYLLKHLLQIDFNGEKIGDYYPGSSPNFCQGLMYEEKALALYVSSRLISHSCLPNCIVSYEGMTKIVRARRVIQPGEKITVSFFPANFILESFELPIETEKRQKYLQRYLITCECLYCEDNSLPRKLYPWKCQYCFNYAITEPDGKFAKCAACDRKFSLHIHKELEYSLQLRFNKMISRRFNDRNLDNLASRMKNIYHFLNLNYIYLYISYTYLHEYYEDFISAAQSIEKIINLRLLWFGESDAVFAANLVYLLINYIKYFLLLKFTDVYKAQFEASVEIWIKKLLKMAIDVLKFHMSQTNIRAFEKIVLDIMNSTRFITLSQIEHVIFYYTSNTSVLIQLNHVKPISDQCY